ncbi:MAG: hypothetical protein WCS37_03570 [Chloroflexota bacterium]|nr:hypothetical protein [Chloroflexota bacterium]
MSRFSFDDTGPLSVEDPQAKVLNNALRHFCDKIEQDDLSQDEDKLFNMRDVIWSYGSLRFRAKLATLDGQFSSGEYFYSSQEPDANWIRLPTPRALAEKLTEAREAKGA